MTIGFDCRSCGLGDVVLSLWIAQGAREEGHEVIYLPGQHDWVVRAFGFDTAETEATTSFGGQSPSYKRELELGGLGPHRGYLWQLELPFSVEPKRPIPELWEECDQWAAELKAARTGGKKKKTIRINLSCMRLQYKNLARTKVDKTRLGSRNTWRRHRRTQLYNPKYRIHAVLCIRLFSRSNHIPHESRRYCHR